MSLEEEVLVVKTSLLAPYLRPGLFRENAEEVLELIDRKHEFLVRRVAEESPDYRQIIPYVAIRNGDHLFVLRRTRKGTDARLHDKVSIGIGGHINPGHGVVEGMQKELDEEVAIDGDYDITFTGILNDDSTEVGRVHLGIVYVLDATTRNVRVLETEKLSGEWHGMAGLTPLREAMETWSQIVFDEITRP